MSDTHLEVRDLRSSYRRNEAIHGISLDVRGGEVVALLGHNGAGKSTTLHCIAGLQPVSHGSIRLDGDDITHHGAAASVKIGIGLVLEQAFVFGDLTVRENLELAGVRVGKEDLERTRAQMLERYPVLSDRGAQRAEALSGGEQRMLSMAMALLSSPRLLILDEPSLGVAPFLVERMMDDIREIATTTGVAVLLVEQNVTQALRVADRAYVMRAGAIIEEQEAASLAKRERLWELF
ncbi:ABC transporter ATP-binding protein [Salinibacterium sp. ZJ450]|uniref:ABC transporter ATP-binding protein n=1 Tax=Salinibacterium sp. ZJ450 TaxID=2708338 RepID=UPI0014222322|nr:ABC transporter ATP-binding protein [Salinibacterium sp. ZJ450]